MFTGAVTILYVPLLPRSLFLFICLILLSVCVWGLISVCIPLCMWVNWFSLFVAFCLHVAVTGSISETRCNASKLRIRVYKRIFARFSAYSLFGSLLAISLRSLSLFIFSLAHLAFVSRYNLFVSQLTHRFSPHHFTRYQLYTAACCKLSKPSRRDGSIRRNWK